MAFPDIDTSYWKTEDPEWEAVRQAAWPRIQKMLYYEKSVKGRTAVKQYFLRGKLPDWDAMAGWDNEEGHVDLFVFLWLHPSWDESLLTALRDAYMASDCIVPRDLRSGFRSLHEAGGRGSRDYSCCSDEQMQIASTIDTDGHNELLFRVMMGDLQKNTHIELKRSDAFGHLLPYEIQTDIFEAIFTMGEWLCVKKMLPINNDFLFQYDLPLEWWYRNCPSNEDYFSSDSQPAAKREATVKALWHIHHFDDVAEGPGPRTAFVIKMRKMLDERPFITEFKEMWQRVKAGELQLIYPWDWDSAKVRCPPLDIDTSYWKTKDPEWMAERKAGWSRIEKMLPDIRKRGKGKTALKQYYLKGKLPDWDAMAWWDDEEGHVDLFCFLWLHPSWDETLLTALRNAYIGSDCIVPRDLRSGFGNLLWAGVRGCEDYSDDPEEEVIGIVSTDGHNELLFRVIMGDLQQTRVEFKRMDVLDMRFQPYQIPMAHFDSIYRMGKWLCVKRMLPFNNDFLYQYDLPLEWWYRSAPTDEDYFSADPLASREATEKALWRIHHFDDVAEGPGPRTTMVKKMRKMLDERPFIGEFKAMWQQVKAGEIQLENPWSWSDAKVIHTR